MLYFIIALIVINCINVLVNLLFLATDKKEIVLRRTRGGAIGCVIISCVYITAYYQLYHMIQ